MIPLKPNRLNYCQFLLSAHGNFTLTHCANHSENISHDSIRRYLLKEKMTARLVWEHVQDDIVASPRGCIIFDDSVLDKSHSHHIDMVQRQYSGNAHDLIKGIAMVNCLYVNPDSGQHWIIDYRLYDIKGDGKTKLDHLGEMLISLVASKGLVFDRVLMDSWYVTKDVMLLIESLGKVYVGPLKSNRQVDDSGGTLKYRCVDSLAWTQDELAHGKIVKIKGFPKEHKVRLFRVAVSNSRTDWVVTNDLAQNSTSDIQDACAIRWEIEQFHRELKQLTGVEKCQCRIARIQRNHIACAVLVSINMTRIARKAMTNIYQLKHGMLSDYLRQELRSPSVRTAMV